LHEEEQLAEATVLDKCSLDVDAVEEHRRQRNDDHLLVDVRNLSEGLQYFGDDVEGNDLLLARLLNGQVRNSCHYVTEDVSLLLVVQKLEQDFQEALLAQVAEDVGVLGQVAHQLNHVLDYFVPALLVDGAGQAVLYCLDLRLVYEVLMQLGLARHIAKGDASGLDEIDLVLLGRVQQVNEWLDLPLLRLRALLVLSALALVLGSHEVLVGGQVGQGDGTVLDSVFVKLAVDGLQ